MKRRRPERPTTYAARTHASPYWIVRYSHEQRFRAARQLVAAAAPRTLLDYGSGDGHFLIGLINARILSDDTELVAFEPSADVAQLLRHNLASSGCDTRVRLITSTEDLPRNHFDYIACMGVLEHLPLIARFVFYDFAEYALTADGLALIDVPVEIGPSIVVKEIGRRVLKRDPADYTLGDIVRVAFGCQVFDPQRFDPYESEVINRHHGFDHRILTQELERRFSVAHRNYTPLRFLPPWLGNQEVFLTLQRRQAILAAGHDH